MIFTKIRYRNIISTGNQWTEIRLNQHKTTLIVGENGAGKSTILDAISFALFNKPFRSGFNKPQLVNSIINKDCVVEIEFHSSQKDYKIVRGIKPAVFEVYEDGRLLNQDANARDYQNYLEKNILKVNHKTFCQVVILSKDDYIPFMRLPAQFRREVVEDLLDLQIFSVMNSILLTKKQQNDQELTQLVADKRLLDQRIELIKQHSEHITSSNKKMIQEKQDRIEEARCQISKANNDINRDRLAIKDFTGLISDQDKQINLQRELAQLKFKLENKIANLSKSIEFFHDNETCPTCSQEIDQQFKSDIIVKKQLSMNEAADALIKLNEKVEKAQKRLESIKKVQLQINELLLDISVNENTVQQLSKYIAELEREVKQVKTHTSHLDSKELPKLNAELADLSLEYNRLSKHRTTLDLAAILLKDSGIKAKIIKQYIPIINNLINKYLGMLDFFVKFTIDEEFEERILSRFRDEFTYGSFSGGEKFRINLALLFTWRAIAKMRNSLNTNILFFDELLDSSLDINGTEEALKILNQTDPGTNIFIISHRVDQMLDKFENVLKFEKRKNFSRLVSI